MSALPNTPRSTFPLPDGWSALEVVEDVVVADGVELHRAGVASVAPGGEEITGSAADALRSPTARSYFELLERAATLEALGARCPVYHLRTAEGNSAGTCTADALFPESDAPDSWRYARSNGVAIHADWQSATLRAHWELAERDRLLRAWYGEIRPERLDLDFGTMGGRLAAATTYDWCAYSFPEPEPTRFSRDICVAGIFGFPKRADAPLILGCGARPDLIGARDAAVLEAMQGLAFLWGEPVTDQPPELGPTPMHHLEMFQYPGHHDVLRRWLDGAHLAFGSDRATRPINATEIAFVDLTPTWLAGGYRVAKAYCAGATPLAFGDVPFAAHLPAELRPHPIA